MSTAVLLVDANPIFLRILLQHLLECCANEVTVVGTCRTGKEALSLICPLQPRLVLLDLLARGLGGVETILALRRLTPFVGIIVVTSLDANRYRRMALAAGADEFVSKASMATDLLPAIRRTISKGDRQQALQVSQTHVPFPNRSQIPPPAFWKRARQLRPGSW